MLSMRSHIYTTTVQRAMHMLNGLHIFFPGLDRDWNFFANQNLQPIFQNSIMRLIWKEICFLFQRIWSTANEMPSLSRENFRQLNLAAILWVRCKLLQLKPLNQAW